MLVEIDLSYRCVCSFFPFYSTAVSGLITSGSPGQECGDQCGDGTDVPFHLTRPHMTKHILTDMLLNWIWKQCSTVKHWTASTRLVKIGTGYPGKLLWPPGKLPAAPWCLSSARHDTAQPLRAILQKAVWWSQTSHSALGATSAECAIGIHVCTCYGVVFAYPKHSVSPDPHPWLGVERHKRRQK